MSRSAALAAIAAIALTALAVPASAVTSVDTPDTSAPAAREAAPAAQVIGDGTATGCTSAAVVRAVRRGGVIRFDCGPEPVTIVMQRTAEVLNTSERVVIDGGGLVTLSGGGERRILRQDTCDEALIWITDHCNDQATPRLVLRNVTFADGYVSSPDLEAGSGGAVYARGGRLRIVNSRFVDNRCTPTGPDHGGTFTDSVVR